MFISGGENIHPEEIEGALYRVTDASEVIVVPVEDEEFGFRPVAFVRLQGDVEIDEAKIISHLERYLPRFKIPVCFFQWPQQMTDARLKPNRRYFQELVKYI
jgi:O-succinylbenzoic acid--CoA ligase